MCEKTMYRAQAHQLRTTTSEPNRQQGTAWTLRGVGLSS
jgi:hypothetical protein